MPNENVQRYFVPDFFQFRLVPRQALPASARHSREIRRRSTRGSTG